MSTKYTITEGPYSLKELASKVKLPQVVLVTQGFYGATEKDTISGGQVMVAFFIKRTRGVTGIYKKRSFHIPLNSAMQFAPIPSEGIQEMYKTVACVFETKPVPAAIAIVSMTRDTHGQVLRPGTILFPNKCEKTLKALLKSFTKKGEMEKAEFTTALGTKVHLPMDCAAGFSTQEKDVKLYLPELMAHVMLPVDVKCFGHQNSRYCNSMNNITLTKVCTEASIIGGLTLEGGKVKDQQFDLPLDLPVKVACIDLTEEDLQRSLYARVRSTYESVDCRFAMHKKVVVNGDARDKAQQEFYSTVRTDIAQDVVTVDVPERIYDEVGFGDAKGQRISNAYKAAQNSNRSGPPVVPRQSSIPPCCFERSEDEPYAYMQLVSRADAAQASASVVPTSSALPHKSTHITTTPVATDIYDEPTRPPCSTNVPHTHRDAASKMPGLGNPAVPFGVPPLLPAQNKKQQKHTAPPLYSKPLQPVLGLPPKTLPQKPAPAYAEIRPDTLSASIYTSLMHNKPTRLPPAPAPKPAVLKGAQTPQIEAKGGDPSPHVDEAGNVDYLKTLTCNDIIRLLEAMDLHQYTDNFMKEHIDGELLACMTDEELQEMGITSSLHRKRFTKVIEGRHSAEQLLECGNPYASVSSHP